MLPQKTQKYWDILKQLVQEALLKDEVPVAAMLVCGEEIVATAHNETESSFDPTRHAEINVLQQGFKKIGKNLSKCEIYITLEPCPMCSHAIKLAQIKTVFFGAYDQKNGAVEHGERIFSRLPNVNVAGGFHEEHFGSLLTQFFKSKR